MTDLVPKPFDEEHWIPIIDCPCGQKNTPVSMYGPLVKTIMGDEVEIVIWACPICDRVPEDDSEIKGYVSEADLLDAGYERVLDDNTNG